MRIRRRQILNRAFTVLAVAAVALMAAALIVLLGPILVRGSRAVVFRGTVEFRRMILDEFGRGDPEAIRAELDQVAAAREPMYDLLSQFGVILSADKLARQADDLYDTYRNELRDAAAAGRISRQEQRDLKRAARDIRNTLEAAFASTDREQILDLLNRGVLEHESRSALVAMPDGRPTAAAEAVATAPAPAAAPAPTDAAGLFEMAETYARGVRREDLDLSRREDYARTYGEAYEEVVGIIRELFGPLPGEDEPELVESRYGATRGDRARLLMDRLLSAEAWVAGEPGQPLQKRRIPRTEQFAGTPLAGLFPMVERDLDKMLRPEPTFYWRYFTDESRAGSLFGGVGPEILGTLLLAGTAMAFAFPLGVVAAAYLVECTREGPVVRVVRVCVNTLAGVPSIVFGLFGLAFFVLFLIPLFGGPSNACILAGGLTLGVLVLPIIIRASEEAIKSVPPSYKEAALALGAGQARTFLTVTLPAALPGILTGVILSLSRAAGETAPILFTAVVASGSWTTSLLKDTPALPYSAYIFATGDDLAAKAPHNQYGMIMTLILLVLIMNIGAIALRSRIARKLRGQ